MKKAIKYLSGMKFRCFMLLTCLILMVGATSCSSDDFGTNLPDDPKQLSKAELIQQALSRMPQTRGENPNAVVMVTTKKDVIIRGVATEDMTIYWDTEGTEPITKGTFELPYHFTIDEPVYCIHIKGSEKAIMWLLVNDSELIHLNVENNTEIEYLDCGKNKLDSLSLTGCPNLKIIRAQENELSSIDVTQLPLLEDLFLEINHLRSLDVSQNPNLQSLQVEYNWLTGIDVSKNPNLRTLEVGGNNITDLDLLKNRNLRRISIESLYLKTLNKLSVGSTSFAYFPNLEEIDVSYTDFTSLDLSNNPFVYGIDIDGTAITQLDISDLSIEYLHASFSNLTNLSSTTASLKDAYDLRIDMTPFENNTTAFYYFLDKLPDRTGLLEGQLWTYSSIPNGYRLDLNRRNWKIYQ